MNLKYINKTLNTNYKLLYHYTLTDFKDYFNKFFIDF